MITFLRRHAWVFALGLALLVTLASPSTTHGAAAPPAETSIVQQVPVVEQVEASAKRLVRAAFRGHVRKARRLASAEVLDHLGRRKWGVGYCYRTSGDPEDDFEYGGPLRWGCNFYNQFGGMGIGYKNVNGVWKALEVAVIAD